MQIVISIPVHEEKEVVVDQIQNYKKYMKNPVIVIHISESFYRNENGRFDEIEKIQNVYINSVHFDVGWGNIAHVHISNYLYICEKIKKFDYFLMHASNELYVRKGVEDYISRYRAGFQRRILFSNKSMWWPCEMAHKDDVLKKIMEKCNAKNIVASQVEGSFYSREIFEKIADATQGIDFSQGESYTREELVFSTIAYSFLEEKDIGYPITYSEVHRYDRGLWKIQRIYHSFSILPVMNTVLAHGRREKVYEWLVNRYESIGNYKIKKATVKEIVKGNRGYILRKNVMEDYPGKFQLYDGNIYAVKRVERKMTNSVRMYIRGLEA